MHDPFLVKPVASGGFPVTGLVGAPNLLEVASNSGGQGADTTGDYFMANNGQFKSFGNLTPPQAPMLIYIDPADYAITGLTAKLRLRAVVVTNGTATGSTHALSLHAATPTAGAANLTGVSDGGLVASSTTTSVVSPTATSTNVLTSGLFDVPSANIYVIVHTISVANITANCALNIHVRLECKYQ